MNKGSQKLWQDRSEMWPDDNGPDPRLTFSFTIHSRDVVSSLTDSLIPKGEWAASAKTLEEAYATYQKRIRRKETVECDLMMHTEFGGFYSCPKIVTPRFNSTYIYIARWRKDGAFMESYQLNQSKFSERSPERNELDNNLTRPGLLAYWIQKDAESNKKIKTSD